jgi:soluble lytic murein transglycosylase-like protein
MKTKLFLLAATALLTPLSPSAAQNQSARKSPFAANRSIAAPILTPSQRADYTSIFDAIQSSNWTAAAAKLDSMPPGPLHAVARAELYLAKGSPKVELAPLLALLGTSPDIPQAAQLARLAQSRGAQELPALPQAERLVWQNGQPRRSRAKSVRGDAVAAQLDAQIQPLIRDNQPTAAEALLNDRESQLPPEALTEFQQRIGWSYYIVGDDVSARRLADKARAGVGEWTLQAEWLAALSAWRAQDCAAAGPSFDAVARRATDLELSAAGHYWAARADMMCGRPQTVQYHLRTAARMSETFYGLLAQRALAIKPSEAEMATNLGASDWRSIANKTNVRDAVALVEIGRTALADEAIRYQAAINPGDHPALIRLAADLNLPETQMWLAHNAPRGASVAMGARYPAPDWEPTRGWRVDPPLVFAHALQESGFRANVVSPAGATGLMQVRPGTAGDIAKGRGEILDARHLTQPSANIEYGQAYLEYLRDDGCTGGLLPKVIAAYNAGPVPVSEWNIREFDRGDPLLYIESIPYWETRAYVPTILRNYWVYEQKAGRSQSPSRDALVQGLWPRFPGLPGPSGIRVKARGIAAIQGRAE